MALPGSGAPISLSQVNTELYRPATNPISMSDSELRTLLQDTSGAISLSSGYFKYKRARIGIPFNAQYNTTYPGSPTYPSDEALILMSPYNYTFTPDLTMDVQVLIVGGGAGGDYRYNSGGGGGGGGGVQVVNMRLTGGVTYTASVGWGGVGNGTTFAGASGGPTSFNGYTSTGGLPSGYSGGYNYGRGGTPNGANGGNIGGYAGSQGTTSSITGQSYVYGSGGGGGGTSGGAGGVGAGSGGGTNQYGTSGQNSGAGGGGGGYYTGGTYYYGGSGVAGCVVIRGSFRVYT